MMVLSPSVVGLPVEVLDNGMRVVCDTMPGVDSIAFGVWVQAGTLDEFAHEHGAAHLLEHMAFKATGRRTARDIAIEIENVGASLDAATSHQRTGYYVRCLRDDVKTTCDILGDILTDPVFRDNDLAMEQEVVVQEIGEAADEPDDLLFEELASIAWGGEGLGRTILGTPQSVRNHTPASIKGFMDATYRAPDMVFAAAGAITLDEACDLARGYFAALPGQAKERQRPLPIWAGGVTHVKRQTEQSHLAIAFRGLGYNDENYLAARLFADVLGGGMSSRLFQKVREQHGLAYSVYGFADIFDRGGLVGAYLGTDAEKAAKALELTLGELGDMAQRVGPEELARAKALARAGYLMARESVAARAEAAASQVMIFGRVRPAHEVVERLMAVSADDVCNVARSILSGAQPAMSVVGPLDAAPLWAMLNDFKGRM